MLSSVSVGIGPVPFTYYTILRLATGRIKQQTYHCKIKIFVILSKFIIK